jgi:hypothetical protein
MGFFHKEVSMDKAIKSLLANPKLLVTWEVVKDFARWAISFFIGWVLDNAYAYFAQSKLDPQVVLAIGAVIKYADYYWHKYNKETVPVTKANKEASMGIIPF